jgi:hypothetical protein
MGKRQWEKIVTAGKPGSNPRGRWCKDNLLFRLFGQYSLFRLFGPFGYLAYLLREFHLNKSSIAYIRGRSLILSLMHSARQWDNKEQHSAERIEQREKD